VPIDWPRSGAARLTIEALQAYVACAPRYVKWVDKTGWLVRASSRNPCGSETNQPSTLQCTITVMGQACLEYGGGFQQLVLAGWI
jgi:hypothetical protein